MKSRNGSLNYLSFVLEARKRGDEEEGGEGFGEGGCGRMPGFDVGRRRRMYRGCVINLWPIE